MNDTLFLTWQYVRFNKGRLSLVVALVTFAALLPLALDLFAEEVLQHLGRDARSTPPGQSLQAIENDFVLLANTLAMMVRVVAMASLVIILGVLTLSLSTRRVEMGDLFRLGCSPTRIGALLTLEFVLISIVSGLLAGAILLLLGEVSADLLRFVLVR